MVQKHNAMRRLRTWLAFVADNRAVTAIEYCLIGTFISLVAMTAIPAAFAVLGPYFTVIRNAIAK